MLAGLNHDMLYEISNHLEGLDYKRFLHVNRHISQLPGCNRITAEQYENKKYHFLKSKYKNSICYVLATRGDLKGLQWIVRVEPEYAVHWDVISMSAVRYGHLEVVKWVRNVGYREFIPYDIISAAENGHLDVVKWLYKNRIKECKKGLVNRRGLESTKGCVESAIGQSLFNGHGNVAKWLIEVADGVMDDLLFLERMK